MDKETRIILRTFVTIAITMFGGVVISFAAKYLNPEAELREVFQTYLLIVIFCAITQLANSCDEGE